MLIGAMIGAVVSGDMRWSGNGATSFAGKGIRIVEKYVRHGAGDENLRSFAEIQNVSDLFKLQVIPPSCWVLEGETCRSGHWQAHVKVSFTI